jgi:4-amino-4-deoxy-L-arabinose transferase-like glycosyltransferase
MMGEEPNQVHEASESQTFNSGEIEERLKKWALALVLAGTVIRVCFLFFATNNGGDALARVAITAKWLQHSSLDLEFGGPNWPPIHFWMMAALSLVVRNVMLGCRLLSLLFGTFSLWVFWRLAREMYGVRAALLSLTLFAFYSLHIGYSTTSSSEAVYLGLLLSALLCFFTYRRTGSLRLLALGGFLLTIDAGIRYETWIFIFLIALLLLFNSGIKNFLTWPHFWSLIAFGLTAGLWPVSWMLHEWKTWGNPLYAISNNYELVPTQLAVNPSHAGLYQLLLPPGVILLTLTPLAVLGGAYALLLAIRERKAREFALVASGFALIQLRSFATGGSLAMARYTLTDGTFLALLAGYGLWRLVDMFRICTYKNLARLTAAVMVLNLAAIISFSSKENKYTDKFRAISPLLQYPRHIEEVGQFLRPRLGSTDLVVIDNYNDESNIVAAAIGLALLPTNQPFLASLSNPGLVWNYIETDKPQYVIFADAGTLRPYMPLPSNCASLVQIRDFYFRCLFQDEIYQVYAISYPSVAYNGPSNSATTKSER